MSTRRYARNAFETGLDGAIGDTDSTITLDTTVGLNFPGYLVFDDDSITIREYIEYLGITGSDLTGVTRGLAGSAAGAQAHSNGARVRSVFVHQFLDDIFTDVETLETAQSTLLRSHSPNRPSLMCSGYQLMA